MPRQARYSLIELDTEQHLASLATEVRSGLSSTPKRIPCRFFYDDAGSKLFEKICELPDYYLTRAEREILQHRAEEIASRFSEPIALVELGSGSSTKTRLLIDALLQCHSALFYTPVDISASILEESALELLGDYEGLEIRAIAGEYQEGLRRLQLETERPKLLIWLGSSIGNLDRAAAGRFMSVLRRSMQAADRLLVGIDLRKDTEVLERAYDDSDGVTALFNKNLLVRINRELGADFDVEAFDFRATYDELRGTVESHLVSRQDQIVTIKELDLRVSVRVDETIHTESSFKYSLREIDSLAKTADLELTARWLDSQERFSLNLFAAAPSAASK